MGEHHDESDPRRDKEQEMLKSFGHYWLEHEFKLAAEGGARHGDALDLGAPQRMAFLAHDLAILGERVRISLIKLRGARAAEVSTVDIPDIRALMNAMMGLQIGELVLDLNSWLATKPKKMDDLAFITKGLQLCRSMSQAFPLYQNVFQRAEEKEATRAASLQGFNEFMVAWRKTATELLRLQNYDVGDPSKENPYAGTQRVADQLKGERSLHMYMLAGEAADTQSVKGVWKVGEAHVQDMTQKLQGPPSPQVAITPREEFNENYQAWEKQSPEGLPSKKRLESEVVGCTPRRTSRAARAPPAEVLAATLPTIRAVNRPSGVVLARAGNTLPLGSTRSMNASRSRGERCSRSSSHVTTASRGR